MGLEQKAAGAYLLLLAETFLLLFLPAGTVNYPEGWFFLILFYLPLLFGGLWLLRRDRELLKKRMNRREPSPRQEKIAALIGILFNTGLVLAGLDQRFGWTKLPAFLKLSAACLMLSAYGICLLTARVNPFLSRTVEVREGQTAVDTGPYRIVRHPMYAGTSLFFAAVPLLLDSWIAFFAFLPPPFLLCRRLLEEEKMLEEGLAGYREYMKRVKYRLIPGIW